MVTARGAHSSAFAKPPGARKKTIAAATIVLTKLSSLGCGRFVRLFTVADCPSPVFRAQAARHARLVSRFRSSHHYAAHSFANFVIKGTLAIYDSSAGFGFEVPTQTRGYNDRNFKSTALAA